MPMQGFFDHHGNIDKTDPFMQKRLNRRFIGGIEHCGQSAAGTDRFETETQTGETLEVWRFKGKRSDLGEIQPG